MRRSWTTRPPLSRDMTAEESEVSKGQTLKRSALRPAAGMMLTCGHQDEEKEAEEAEEGEGEEEEEEEEAPKAKKARPVPKAPAKVRPTPCFVSLTDACTICSPRHP